MGITFSILSRFGNMPCLKDRFIILLKGFANSFLNGILFGPLTLFAFTKLIRSSAFSGRVGERKIVSLFSGPR